jgi:hypothetical protein
MRVVYSHSEKRWVWRCDVCQKQGFWSDEWQWFGSMHDAERGAHAENIVSICSEACKAEAVCMGKVPSDAPHLDDQLSRVRRVRKVSLP